MVIEEVIDDDFIPISQRKIQVLSEVKFINSDKKRIELRIP